MKALRNKVFLILAFQQAVSLSMKLILEKRLFNELNRTRI